MAEEKHGKTLFVRNLPYSATNDTLEKVFSDIGPVKSCFVVSDRDSGKCRGFGYVKFTLLEDAEKALTTVKRVEGRHVHIVYANKKEKKKRFGKPSQIENEKTVTEEITQDDKHEDKEENKKSKRKKKKTAEIPVKGEKQAPNPMNEGKRARVIVRNLAFKCTKEQLQKAFEVCGEVVDVHIPKKASGTRLGFGFVQFANKAQAGMAVRELNEKEICGRMVAVDWALPKDKFETKMTENDAAKEANVEEVEDQCHDESMDVDEADEGDEESKKDDKCDKDNSSSSDEDESEDEEEESSSEEEDEDETDEEEDSGIEDESEKRAAKPERESDVGEGRTIFMRNLPFSTENEELEEFFSQFGDVKFARIVYDRNSGIPKGSAFVQFKSKDSADSCLSSAANDGLSIGGRQLIVNLAVSRHQAGEFIEKKEKEKKKEQKDSRNLYLAREGMIRPGTEAAKTVPAPDLALRTKIDAAKRKKLRDQNIFVSSTRMCVHNIPPTVSEKKLRGIVLKAADDKAAKLVECRIMRDMKRVNAQGVGKAKGFAFCAFTQHEHALNALRHLNNNPDIFGDKKRPIVEFSLENRSALEAKQKRLEKSRIKLNQKRQEAQKDATVATPGKGETEKKKRKFKKKKAAPSLEGMKAQDKIARSLHKGPLGLPSHSGPKQRHKARPSQQGKIAGNNKTERRNNNMNRAIKQPQKRERPVKMKNPNKKRKDIDSFDKLVASYKQKIMSSAKF